MFLTKEDCIARFGKMPDTADEAREMLQVLVAEMTSPSLTDLVLKIHTHKHHARPAFQLGLQLAQAELDARK